MSRESKPSFREPEKKETKKFVRWVKKRKRSTASFLDKFGLLSLKKVMEEANKSLDNGKIVLQGYYKYKFGSKVIQGKKRTVKGGNFFRIVFDKEESEE